MAPFLFAVFRFMLKRSREYKIEIERLEKQVRADLAEGLDVSGLKLQIENTCIEWKRDMNAWTSLSSSALSAVCYDPDEQILTIQFPRGEIYTYIEVDSEVFEGLLDEDERGASVGKYFRAYIRDVYKTSRK